MRNRSVVVASLSVMLFTGAASADSLILRDGTRVEGTAVGMTAHTITFRSGDGISRRYATSQVEAVEFFTPDRDASRARNSRRLEVSAGTEVLVRTTEAIDSNRSDAGRLFSGLVEENVLDRSGQIIVPDRSRVQLVLREVSAGGATGSPEVVVDIQSITIDGRRYMTSTEDLMVTSDTGIGSNKRTAETVGGGALLGTIVGAIAGGGKGAAIGGIVGAAGGAGAQIITRGRDVRIPAETLLRFRLDRAIALPAAE